MRHAIFVPCMVAIFALLCACSNVEEVTLTGPSVTDQLNSRGYMATTRDTTFPMDTTKLQLDSLERR